MRPSTILALSFVGVHAIAVTVLHWPHWWTSLLSLTCFAFAWVGAGEPEYEKSARHKDVRAAQATRLGGILMRREGWIFARPELALGAIAGVSGLAVLTVLALSPVLERTSAEATPLVIVQISVWTPAVLLAVGWLGSMAVHIGPLSGIAVGASLLFGVTSALAGDSQTSLRILACDLGVIASVFCVDQLRGARRAFEPKPERPAQG